jgi:hypothetical protein
MVQRGQGGWSYWGADSVVVDVPNAWIATMALASASGLGIEIQDEAWQMCVRSVVACSGKSSIERGRRTPKSSAPGLGYSTVLRGEPRSPLSYGSATALGAYALTLSLPRVSTTTDLANRGRLSLADALDWLLKRDHDDANPGGAFEYRLFYSMALVRLLESKALAVADAGEAIAEVRERVLGEQRTNGSWGNRSILDTAVALLALGAQPDAPSALARPGGVVTEK